MIHGFGVVVVGSSIMPASTAILLMMSAGSCSHGRYGLKQNFAISMAILNVKRNAKSLSAFRVNN